MERIRPHQTPRIWKVTKNHNKELEPRSWQLSREEEKEHCYIIKVKTEEEKSRKMMKSIQESLEAIKVNLAENWKPRKIVPTNRANVWCRRCGEPHHFVSKYNRPAHRRKITMSIWKKRFTTPYQKRRRMKLLLPSSRCILPMGEGRHHNSPWRQVSYPNLSKLDQIKVWWINQGIQIDHKDIVTIVEVRITMSMFVHLRDKDKVLHWSYLVKTVKNMVT